MTHVIDSVMFSCFHSFMFKKDLEFEIGDHVYLKASSMKEVKRFGKKESLVPMYQSLQNSHSF